jgi:hypothetical protein
MPNQEPLETLAALLTLMAKFCEENDPSTVGRNYDPEVLAEVMGLWDTTNALSEVFLRAWRIDRGMVLDH